MTAPSLRSFRLACKPEYAPLVERLLQKQGAVFEPDPFFPFARRLVFSPQPLGASLAAFFGYIYIQDRSSMLPPVVLSPPQGSRVLDMCASPGGKTGLLGLLVGESGFVLGNEPSKNRLATLRRNLQTMNMLCCATTSHPGEALPLPTAGAVDADTGTRAPGWDHILLDPPCSGWGTVEKNPQVMRLWQGDKVKPLLTLQRKLLAEAYRLLRPGGRLVYSTCTTNVEENEKQVLFACAELGLRLVPAPAPAGFSLAGPGQPACPGSIRIHTGGGGQGFFVALLEKSPDAPAPESKGHSEFAPQGDNSAAQSGFGSFRDKDSRFVGERRRHGKKKELPGRSGKQGAPIARECMASAFARPDKLPPGEIAAYNGVAHFIPELARDFLPERFAWKGFPLGKAAGDGSVRTGMRLRGLMPSFAEARALGLPTLVLDDLDPALALQKGQSLAVDCREPELGLYFQDLPLCRLQVKGRRALLAPS